jgi:PAS domain S-box-containing protein
VLRALEWILLGAGSAGAIVTGVLRHRPARTGPWLLLAGAIVSLATGDVFYALDMRWMANLCYYALFVLVASSLLQLTRGGAILVDRARLIDLLSFACATLLVIWVFLIGGNGQIGHVSAADVMGSLLLTGVAARLRVATGPNPSATLLLIGAAGLLAGDVVYPIYETWEAELGFVVLYLAWGAAALHPSMARMIQPVPVRPTPWRGHWAALLGLSVATPPVVLMVEAINGDVRDGVVIAVAGGITFTLAITRLADSVAQSSQTLARERALRQASAALVAAADVPEVDRAVRAAVGQLMPADAVRKLVFATDNRALTLEALPSADARPQSRSWWVDDPDARAGTLVCPLWLEPLAVARPSGGALVLTGRRETLNASRDALEVLAGQAALALDRISLVEAVGRRDSDLYLRAVVRNTADVMLVIDEDQRIRYASPALGRLLGMDELPPLATLDELVAEEDRSQVRRAFRSEGDGVLFCALRRGGEQKVLIEARYRDLRSDRLVQGFVVTIRDVTHGQQPDEQVPQLAHRDELPAWVNRRSARHKFRY